MRKNGYHSFRKAVPCIEGLLEDEEGLPPAPAPATRQFGGSGPTTGPGTGLGQSPRAARSPTGDYYNSYGDSNDEADTAEEDEAAEEAQPGYRGAENTPGSRGRPYPPSRRRRIRPRRETEE